MIRNAILAVLISTVEETTEIQGITKTVKDEELESKIIDIFSALNISISSKDVGDSLSWKR